MYLRLRLEKPRISGKLSFRSDARRSITLAPQPCSLCRCIYAGQCIFGDQTVLLLAQQQANGRFIIGCLELRIDGGQIEV